jgi:DNA recombination protein RmuC
VTILSWVLLGGLVIAAGVAAWLFSQREAARVALLAERGLKDEVVRRAEEAERRLDAVASRVEEAERRVSDAVAEAGVLRERLMQTESRHREQFEAQERHHAEQIASERKAVLDARAEFEQRGKAMEDHFKAAIQTMAGDALKQSAEHLLKITESKINDATAKAGVDLDARRAAVENLVKPIADTLKRTDEKLQQFDRERAASVSALTQQAASMTQAHDALRRETANLSNALRKPQVRGRWGEVQLRRVVELAGMRDYCDFNEQHSTSDDQGNNQRPDMVVRMPGGRCVVIDAKTNIEPYMDALDSPDDAGREMHLERFADGVAKQVTALSKKSYWENVPGNPEFVVMFVPGDQFVDAALSRRPHLIETAANERVILASPSTLIGLLRAVYVGWREQHVSQRADELIRLGRELHERAAVVLGHADGLGDALNKAVERYNQFQRSMDTRIMPTLRRFEELDAKSGKELPDPPAIVTVARVNVVPGRVLPDSASISSGTTEN